MPIPNDYHDMISALNTSTSQGHVPWKSHEFGFIVQLGESGIRVWGGTDDELNREFVAFGLLDEKGQLLENWSVDDGENDYPVMIDLLNNAKRTALGIPRRLRAIIETLRTRR